MCDTDRGGSSADALTTPPILGTTRQALVGQEVVITLFDNSTRTGTVQNVDPVNFSVALLKVSAAVQQHIRSGRPLEKKPKKTAVFCARRHPDAGPQKPTEKPHRKIGKSPTAFWRTEEGIIEGEDPVFQIRPRLRPHQLTELDPRFPPPSSPLRLQPRPPLIRGSRSSPENKEAGAICVIPGHAVKAVVVEGGQKLALEALRGGHGHMFAGNVMIPVNHLNPYGATVPRPERTMSLEFLRSYSNPPGTSNGQGGGHGHGIGASDAHSSGKADAGYGLYGGGAGYGGNAVPLQRGFVNETGGGGLGFEMAAERRARVRCALEAARVPVQEVQETASPAPALMVMGCLRLPFPYTADACECPNEIVLSKVRQLIDTVR